VSGDARVSAIIVTMSRPAELALTVTSLMAGTTTPAEVVVVDASADDRTELTVAQLAAGFRRVAFAYRRMPPGLPAQRNAGLDASSGDILLFLDDDVTLEPDYLSELLKAFDDAAVGAACGLIINQVLPGRHVRFFQWLFRQVRYAPRSYLQRSGLPTFLFRPERRADVGIMTGCNMAFRREAAPRFDERINYFDDDDASRVAARRWRLVQVPTARLEHRVAAGGRPAPPAKARRRVLEQRLLHRRHVPQNVTNVLCYYYSVAGAAAAAALRLKPRLFLGVLLGLWDVLRTRGGRNLDAAPAEELIPKPE
jgi:glycosyltransferase involved in cell wall biosynthesis